MGIKCFMVRYTNRARLSLRRYWGDKECSGWIHNAHTPIGEGTYVMDADGRAHRLEQQLDPNETRWPTACEKCGAPVPEAAEKQLFSDCIYVDDAGKEYSLRQAKLVPGMMWNAWWAPECWKGPDGLSLIVSGSSHPGPSSTLAPTTHSTSSLAPAWLGATSTPCRHRQHRCNR